MKGPQDKEIGGPSVSVVVPSYNHGRFVASTIRSIIKQTRPPSELLVIDDGSTDDSARVIEAALNNAPFPSELIVARHRGLCATLNHALKLTTGEYFAYLGSDDLWLEDFLRARVERLRKRTEAVLAYGHSYIVDSNNRIIDCTADWADYADGDARTMLIKTIAPMSPTVLYVREALARYGWNEDSGLEDYELYLRLSLEGEFAFDSRVLSAWRWHEGNTSWNQQMMLEENIAALERVSQDFGFTDHDLKKIRKRIHFDRAEDFLRLGDKRKAVQLVLQNLEAAQPARSLRIGLRLLLPYRTVAWQRKRKQLGANRRYGTIDI